jgi:hypothetical protein
MAHAGWQRSPPGHFPIGQILPGSGFLTSFFHGDKLSFFLPISLIFDYQSFLGVGATLVLSLRLKKLFYTFGNIL